MMNNLTERARVFAQTKFLVDVVVAINGVCVCVCVRLRVFLDAAKRVFAVENKRQYIYFCLASICRWNFLAQNKLLYFAQTISAPFVGVQRELSREQSNCMALAVSHPR